MRVERVDCIIPAAGRSQRMGEWKPLLPFDDSTIIQAVVTVALEACERVLLVAGYRGEELASLFDGQPRVEVVEHADWRQGMFSSIRAAAARVSTRRFFVTLGDMPWIRPETYRALRDSGSGDSVVFPVHDGRRGHPVLFPRHALSAIAAADPATGSMRRIAETLSVRELEWPDDSVLRDVDTPEDLDRR